MEVEKLQETHPMSALMNALTTASSLEHVFDIPSVILSLEDIAIGNANILLNSYGKGVHDIVNNALYSDPSSSKLVLKTTSLYNGLINYIKNAACGEDFRDDIEFHSIFYKFLFKIDVGIVAYALNLDGPNSHNFNKYNLESVLNIAADLLQIKSLNAQNGWPVRLKQVKASNGKVLKSLVVNTKRISFQICYVLLYIIRMYQIVPQRVLALLYIDHNEFLGSYYEFKVYDTANPDINPSLPSNVSRLQIRKKIESFSDSEKNDELKALFGYGNMFRILKEEGLDSKFHKDFILDFVTRLIEGNSSNIVRHWTGSGQTAATERRVLIYKVECSKPLDNIDESPKPPEQSKKRKVADVSNVGNNLGFDQWRESIEGGNNNNNNNRAAVDKRRSTSSSSNSSSNNLNIGGNQLQFEANILAEDMLNPSNPLYDSFLFLDHDFCFEI